MSLRIAAKRLQKELTDLQKSTPEGITIIETEDLKQWKLGIRGLGLYQDEQFALLFKFSDRYPIDSPEVTFVKDSKYAPPIHPHIYSNGHICASILDSEWSPVLNVQSVCLTLQSMLASAKEKKRPEGNDDYVKRAPLSPKQSRWVFHDDSV